MPGRVLNFSEFSSKYSTDQKQDAAASFDTFSNSADNFKEGFDKETYGKPEAGPNRPINTGSEQAPAQPGEEGAPKFNPAAADDTELEPKNTAEPAEAAETEQDADETPEPEMGANPKEKKKANESLLSLLESYDDCEDCEEGAMYLDQEADHAGPIVICSSCGTQKAMDAEVPEEDPWYHQGLGMQCGCNM